MTDLPGYEERNWILGQLRAAGHEVDGAQLGRWHRAGLIPKPDTKPLGKTKGTESRYPQGTLEQLEALVRARESASTYAELGWRLWWDGWNVKLKVVRGYLAHVADGLEWYLSAPDGTSSSVTDSRYLKGPLRELRRSLGPKAFADLVETTFAMLLDEFQPGANARDFHAAASFVDILQLGFDPVLAVEHELPSAKDVALSLGESGQLVRRLVTKAKTALAATFDDDVLEGRDLARLILASQIVPGSPMSQLVGSGALGESLLTRSYESYRSFLEGVLVLLLLTAPYIAATQDVIPQLEHNAERLERLATKKGEDET